VPTPTQPLTVLLSAPRPQRTTNPYVVMLAECLEAEPEVDLRYFSWGEALRGSYDVFHAHWPENLASGRTPLRRVAREGLTALFLLRMQVRHVGIVRTMHNIELPQGLTPVQRLLLERFDAMTDVRIRINETTEAPDGQTWVTILHGHYRDWYASYERDPQVPGRVTYFGSIRRYKSIDRLLDAFESTRATRPDLSLSLSGKPSDDELRASVDQACADDPRITAHLDYIDDAELVRQVSAAAIAVLPYRHMHNSGGVLAALSLDRPVLVPANEANDRLAAEVGEQWVQRFGDELTGDDLVRALDAVTTLPAGAQPDLGRRHWASAARDHVAAYRKARALRRGEPA
jgi:glycosyltransferase involved in cell wall biosynthesis